MSPRRKEYRGERPREQNPNAGKRFPVVLPRAGGFLALLLLATAPAFGVTNILQSVSPSPAVRGCLLKMLNRETEDSLFTRGPSDMLDHATSEIASGSKLGVDATKKLPGEGFKRAGPPLIKMDAAEG